MYPPFCVANPRLQASLASARFERTGPGCSTGEAATMPAQRAMRRDSFILSNNVKAKVELGCGYPSMSYGRSVDIVGSGSNIYLRPEQGLSGRQPHRLPSSSIAVLLERINFMSLFGRISENIGIEIN